MGRGGVTLRRVAFWVTVGGVSLISPFVLNLAADKVPVPGLAAFRDFINKSGG